jgi:outer membrane protein OmpA-like peptidoglycan-associated protein
MNEKIDSAKLALLDSNLKFTDSTLVFQDEEGNLVLPPSIKDSGSIENINKLVKGDTVSINNILFDFGKSELRPEAIRELNKIKEMMKAFPKLELDISAFTDDIGSVEANIKLSQSRAETAKKYLVDLGIDPEKIKSNGYGESNPIDTNATEIGRQKNRRVVFKLNKTQ